MMNDYVTLHPSSSASATGVQGWKQSTGNLQSTLVGMMRRMSIILSETVADDGVIGMLSGISLRSTER